MDSSMARFDRRSTRQRESKDPVARYLGELQAQVMGIYWRRNSATVREALETMNGPRRKKLAYTTLLTLITRLWQRGLLERELEGRGFRYRAAKSREVLLGELSEELIDRLLDDFGDVAVAQIGERLEHLDAARLKRLKAARGKSA
jgi:predicted transcriptional regulator